eukprot:6200919-Pleurochrysis_carterae.AAC.1
MRREVAWVSSCSDGRWRECCREVCVGACGDARTGPRRGGDRALVCPSACVRTNASMCVLE